MNHPAPRSVCACLTCIRTTCCPGTMCHACDDAGCCISRECLVVLAARLADEDAEYAVRRAAIEERFKREDALLMYTCAGCGEVTFADPGVILDPHDCGGTWQTATVPPATVIRARCDAQGFYLITADTHNPGVILARLLAVLLVLDPAAHARVTAPGSRFSRIPAEAHAQEMHPHWDGDGTDALTDVFTALDAAAPAGCRFGMEGQVHRMGFFK